MHAALSQRFQVRLCRGMVQHLDVHRRRDDYSSWCCEIECRKKIIGLSVRKFSGCICGAGRYNKRVNGLGDADVVDGGVEIRLLAPRLPQASNDLLTRERRKRKRTHKLLGSSGHDDLYADAGVLQQANDFARFVRGDAATHSESDLHTIIVVG